MRSNMKNILKLIGILIIVILSLIFTYLTLETVNIDGAVSFCRPVEFWCYRAYNTNTIYYLPDEERYEMEWTDVVYSINVNNGQFQKDQITYKTNAPDGYYEELAGYLSYDSDNQEDWFIVADNKHKLIGAVR